MWNTPFFCLSGHHMGGTAMEMGLEKFGKVWGASGVQNFFGDGWPWHKALGPVLDFRGMTFVAKTTTLHERPGNMPLNKNLMPREPFPTSMWVNFSGGYALNSIGLSGPGAKALFEKGAWQKRQQPFFISFMSAEVTPGRRIEELKEFLGLLKTYLPGFQAPVGLQINFSCPNIGLKPDEVLGEIEIGLSVAESIGLPLVPKINLEVPPDIARQITLHPACAGICVTNTIPFGRMEKQIDWQKLFRTKSKTPGPEESPLYKQNPKFGGGGLSGKPLFPLLYDWVRQAKAEGAWNKPLNVGGGILSKKDLRLLASLLHGGDSISLGSVAFLRPWRVQGIIREARRIL